MTTVSEIVFDDSYENDVELSEDRKTEPIKSLRDINAIYDYFIDRKKFRDAALFMIGINIGPRVGDLIKFKYGAFYDRTWKPTRDVYFVEEKTRNTRREKKTILTQKWYRQHAHLTEEDMAEVIAKIIADGRKQHEERTKTSPDPRHVYANDKVYEALDLLRAHSKEPVIRDHYLFRNESNNATGENKPIDRTSARRAIQGACSALGIKHNVATHGLRKTFGYHFMECYGRSDAALQTLQRMFGHSSPVVTLRYIGIEAEDFEAGYRAVGDRFSSVVYEGDNIIRFAKPYNGDNIIQFSTLEKMQGIV